MPVEVVGPALSVGPRVVRHLGVPGRPRVAADDRTRADMYPLHQLLQDFDWQRQQQGPPINVPYNCLMGRGGPRRWYAVATEMHIGIYWTHYEANRLVVGVPTNSHKKFNRPIDAECWLEQQFQINGNAY